MPVSLAGSSSAYGCFSTVPQLEDFLSVSRGLTARTKLRTIVSRSRDGSCCQLRIPSRSLGGFPLVFPTTGVRTFTGKIQVGGSRRYAASVSRVVGNCQSGKGGHCYCKQGEGACRTGACKLVYGWSSRSSAAPASLKAPKFGPSEGGPTPPLHFKPRNPRYQFESFPIL